MANVYENELYGKLLPDVFIDKITLENSGYIPVEENPHIDNEREEIKPEQQNESLKITLNVSVKEKYKNDTVGNWLSEIDFQKYMKIKVYEINDERLTSLMNLSKDFAVPLDLNTFSNSKSAVLRTLYGYLRMSRAQTINLIKNKVKIYTIPMNEEQNRSSSNNKQTSVETLDDGTKVLNTHFKKIIDKPKSKIEHLSLYCVSYLDHLALIKDFDMQPTRKLINFLVNMNKVVGEILFDNYEILNESYVFLGQDSKIWTGDVHKNAEGQYMTGLRETSDSIPLQRRTIQNSTVQDFRRRQRLEKVNFDFNPVKKYFEDFKPVNGSTNDRFLARNNSYFGDISIAIDEDRDAKLAFSVALKNLLFDNSQYSFLIKNHDSLLADRLARMVTITSLKIFRERVKLVNSNNSKITVGKQYIKFSKNEPKKTLVHCRNMNSSIDTADVFLRQVPTALYPDIVEYGIIDRTASELSDGLYRYSIEIEVSDPFKEFLEDKVETLSLIVNEFEKYRIESEKLTVSKYFAEIQDPHIAHPDEKDVIGSIIEGNYNILTNSFTESFISKMNEVYSITTTAPWILYTSVYADTLSMFVEEVEKTQLQSELQKFSSPTTGSPEGIRMVIGLIRQLISEIQKILGKTSVVDNLSGRTMASKSIKTFVVSHDFNNQVFDSNIEGNVLVDYLEKKEPRQAKQGMARFTVQEFRNRMDKEVEKYFISRNANIETSVNDGQIQKTDSRNNLYSFLSPAKMILKKEQIDLSPTTNENQIRKINNIMSYAKTNKKTFYKKSLEEEDLDLSIFNLELQENYSVTITGFKIQEPPLAIEEEKIKDEKVEKIEENKNKNIKIRSADKITDLRKIPKIQKKGIKEFISILGPKANKKTRPFSIEKKKKDIQDKVPEKKRKELPIQITSILAGNSKDTKKNIVPSKTLKQPNYTENQIINNIGSVKEIQVLTGYEKNKDGKVLMNKPKWEKMTEEKISSIPSNVEITCRLADFKEKDLVAEDITKSAKITNSSFTILGDAAPIVPQTKEQNYSTTIKNKNIEVSKDLINTAVKNENEKTKFPTAVTKTTTVSSQPIEEIVARKDVKVATEKKQKEVITNKQTLPKVSAQKTQPKKAETKKKQPKKKKTKGKK